MLIGAEEPSNQLKTLDWYEAAGHRSCLKVWMLLEQLKAADRFS